MKAAVLTGLRQMEIRDIDPPRIERDDYVLLQVNVVGICGSDVHTYKEGGIGPSRVVYPWILGHECACMVVEAGRGVKNITRGQRVAVDPLIVCHRCDQCLSGRRHTCRNQVFLATPGMTPGALVEYLVMPADCCLPIPDSMTMEQAVLTEPLSIGLHSWNLSGMESPGSVVILGCGPIGLSVLLALKAAGRFTTYVTDLLEYRLALARRYGAAWTGLAEDGGKAVKAIRNLQPLGVDCVFECAGKQETIDQGLALLKPGGTLVLVGIPSETRVSFDAHTSRRGEFVFQNVRRQNACLAPAIELIASGKVDVKAMATHHFGLAQAPEAFELVSEYRDGVVKAMIHVSDK